MSNFSKIDSFIANSFFHSKGFLRPNRFETEWTLPNVFVGVGDVANIMKHNTISVELPGFNLSDNETPLRHRISRRNTDNVTVQFFESADITMKSIMHQWIDTIIRHQSDTDNFLREYLDNIVATLKVYPLQPNGERADIKIHDIFTDVFPIAAGQIQYDIGDDTTLGRIPVTFKYRYHTIATT